MYVFLLLLSFRQSLVKEWVGVAPPRDCSIPFIVLCSRDPGRASWWTWKIGWVSLHSSQIRVSAYHQWCASLGRNLHNVQSIVAKFAYLRRFIRKMKSLRFRWNFAFPPLTLETGRRNNFFWVSLPSIRVSLSLSLSLCRQSATLKFCSQLCSLSSRLQRLTQIPPGSVLCGVHCPSPSCVLMQRIFNFPRAPLRPKLFLSPTSPFPWTASSRIAISHLHLS